MARLAGFTGVLLCWSVLAAAAAPLGEPSPPAKYDVPRELEASELQEITLAVLKDHPILSASPGIKAAFRYQHYSRGETADVVFYPHAESRGIKYAIQAFCNRESEEDAWDCSRVESRRYVKLDSQDFEVRVKGSLDMAGVLAITEATRPVAESAVADVSTVDEVQIIFPANDGYLVGWGSEAGGGAVTVEAHLRDGGSAANPGDWEAFVLPEE